MSHPADASKAALLLAHMGDVDSAPQIRNLLAYGLVHTGFHWQGLPVGFGPNAEAAGITWLRRNSAEALGVLKDADAVPLLCKALRSPDYETRRAAEQSLVQIGGRLGTYKQVFSLLSDGTWLYKPGQKEPFKRVCDFAVDVIEKLSGETFGSYPSRNAEPDEALRILNRRVEECRRWLSEEV
jgi:HEAT repeat protein